MLMMRFRNTLSAFVLAALAAGAGGGDARADGWDQIQKAGRIRISVDPSAPPYSSVNERGEYTGSEIDVARRLAEDWGLRLEMVSTSPANRIPYLITGKTDLVISTLSITEERKKVIDFSRPYSGIQIVVGAPSALNVSSLSDLAGKRVAVTRASTNDAEITQNAAPGTVILRFEDDATSITALLSGQADAYVTAPALLTTIQQRNPALNMTAKLVLKTNVTGIGVKKGEEQLRSKLDQWVASRLQDGVLEAIYQKGFGLPLPKEVRAN